ncbi:MULTISPECIES: hypothetical protein [unclassified Bradyrhizobium]|uniref:hypothetical protein n=1 Tax=unclassified Bradyrhizobium TaxID=2631580 RepID=UPI0028E49493|nr:MULTISPECIES: hypothetical protein [unclassified Bradyrhizobium]
MTEDEMMAVRQVDKTPITVSPDDGPDRTLLYGYDCERYTWHIYQKDGQIHRAIYLGSNPSPQSFDSEAHFVASALVPNKRLYPEHCDFDFCMKLAALGIHLPFTTYGSAADGVNRKPFAGRTF